MGWIGSAYCRSAKSCGSRRRARIRCCILWAVRACWFLRTHQKHLVNLAFVREMRKIGAGIVVLSDGARVPVATRRKPEVMACLMGSA